jgi:hypothetical protein
MRRPTQYRPRAGTASLNRPPVRLAGLMACVAAMTLAACGGGSVRSSSTTVPTSSRAAASPATTQTSAAVSDDVLAAYRSMWADLVTAAETSDYQSPLLSQHATGDALTLLVQGLARDQLHDIVTRGVTAHHPAVTSLSTSGDPNHATIRDCFDDTHWIEYTTAGRKAKNNPGGRRATIADLVETGGTWKVSQLTIEATGTC